MAKISVEVANRIKVAEYVESSVSVHGATVAKGLAGRFQWLTAEQAQALVTGLGAELGTLTATMHGAELAYTAEQADDDPKRATRDAHVGAALDAFTSLRGLVHSVLGDAGLGRYGLEGLTPRGPKDVEDYGNNVLSLLRKHPSKTSNLFGASFDTDAAVAGLEPLVAAVTASVAAVTEEVRELQGAMVARDRAVDAWMDFYPAIGSSLTGLYALAGEKEQADRLRPSARRTIGRDPELESEAAVTPSAAG